MVVRRCDGAVVRGGAGEGRAKHRTTETLNGARQKGFAGYPFLVNDLLMVDRRSVDGWVVCEAATKTDGI